MIEYFKCLKNMFKEAKVSDIGETVEETSEKTSENINESGGNTGKDKGKRKKSSIWSTHPSTEDRIANLRNIRY